MAINQNLIKEDIAKIGKKLKEVYGAIWQAEDFKQADLNFLAAQFALFETPYTKLKREEAAEIAKKIAILFKIIDNYIEMQVFNFLVKTFSEKLAIEKQRETDRDTEALLTYLKMLQEQNKGDKNVSGDIKQFAAEQLVVIRKELAEAYVRRDKLVAEIRELQEELHQIAEERKQMVSELKQVAVGMRAEINAGMFDDFKIIDARKVGERLGEIPELLARKEIKAEEAEHRFQLIVTQCMRVKIATPSTEQQSKWQTEEYRMLSFWKINNNVQIIRGIALDGREASANKKIAGKNQDLAEENDYIAKKEKQEAQFVSILNPPSVTVTVSTKATLDSLNHARNAPLPSAPPLEGSQSSVVNRDTKSVELSGNSSGSAAAVTITVETVVAAPVPSAPSLAEIEGQMPTPSAPPLDEVEGQSPTPSAPRAEGEVEGPAPKVEGAANENTTAGGEDEEQDKDSLDDDNDVEPPTSKPKM